MCLASGKVTDDQFMQAKPRVYDEILEDEKDGSTSRTRQALITGMLKFADCPACNGKGRVPA